MLLYVLFGGMIATTWVQIIKAVLLLCGVSLLTILVLAQFGFSPGGCTRPWPALRAGGARAGRAGDRSDRGRLARTGADVRLARAAAHSMRFYTVPDSSAARGSVLYATGFIGYFYLIIPIVGFGASALVGREAIRAIDAGGNMAAPLIAELLGGTPFLGFIAAVAFATILAVVAGLTLAGASAISHDIFLHVVRKGHATEREQVNVAESPRSCSASRRPARRHFQGPERRVHGRPGVRRGRERQLPGAAALDRLASLHHRRRRRGDRYRGLLSVGLIVLSPTVMGGSVHYPAAIFPLRNPAIISMSAAFSPACRLVAVVRAARAGAVRRREATGLSGRRRRVVERRTTGQFFAAARPRPCSLPRRRLPATSGPHLMVECSCR